MIPTIDRSLEKFDVEYFEKNSTRGTFVKNIDNDIIIEDRQSFGYIRQQYDNNSVFNKNILFYRSGNIKEKGIAFNEGSPIGIWYYFDESGKLVKEENTDEGYNFTPEKVVGYCEKNKIELPKGYHESGFYTQVRKETLNGKKVWVIKYLIPGGDIQKLVLDGQTGKELEKKVVPFVSS
ncbi:MULTISPECIES: hypothetical protein [unclassified Chryseobacterium]|uniref:hypothetical protein n=1 Tax=unclassified Chryseobacterium TaxID=2593645 RepID=UPI00100BDF29|nr:MULTISPECIES: hypothetical protein [unclassified Chryseobacterium]RXM50315.1 hypothetical protein BOQ64_19020 [Chryseobacterium sp. CH25]RXM62645.1 hypothetical protein BOQ60_21200 [Chryseobacterium sp. CH1]